MKKSNKEFVAEFMNQLDSGKLLQLVQGLLNQEEILQNEEILVSNNQNNQAELDNSNITIEKLSISEKPINPNFLKDDDDEKIIQWFAEKAKTYLEPKKSSEVPIEEDIYGLMFTQEGKIEAERQRVLKEAETFASLSPQEQFKVLIEKNKLEKQTLNKIKPMGQSYIEKYSEYTESSNEKLENLKRAAEVSAALYKAAEYRVDNNIKGRNFAETAMNDKVKSDRLAKEINNRMTDKNYQFSIFTDLQSHIQEVQKKNRELEEKEKLKPQVEAIEKELALTKELDELLNS